MIGTLSAGSGVRAVLLSVKRNRNREGVEGRQVDTAFPLFVLIHDPRGDEVPEYGAEKIVRCPVLILIDPGDKSQCGRYVQYSFQPPVFPRGLSPS